MTMENTIKIPGFLHEIHGKQSNWLDIITIHLYALLAIGALLFLTNDLALPSWKEWVLIALAYDLGGGVLANFTYSTKKHYQSRKRRIVFLSLHFLQPLFMIWVFPEQTIGIAIFSGFTIFSAFIVDAIQDAQKQLIIGAFLTFTGIIGLLTIPIEWNSSLLLLLTLFLLKLPLSFSVRWHNLGKIDF